MRRRLVLVVAATTSLVVVAFAIPLAALVRNVAHDRAITAAERDAAALAPVLAVTEDPELVEAAIAQTPTGGDGRLAVFLPSSHLGDQTPVDRQALSLARDGSGFTEDEGGDANIYSPVVTGGGDTTVVRARVPDAMLDEGVTTAWAALAAVGIILVGAGCLLADRLARSLTRDASGLAHTARALAAGETTARAQPGGVPEIGDVALALNTLADRIDELRAAERERVADLSHRLRTPLTVLRLESERLRESALTDAVDRLEHDVTQLVHDARRPLHDGLVDERCDLVAVVTDRASFWNALAEDDGRPTRTTITPGPLVVRLPDVEAMAMVDTILENVFTHTPEGTAYEIEVSRRGADAILTVRDDGPGVTHSEDMRLRGRSGGGSTGLGLDIVHHAARAAGGTVSVRSPQGSGFTVAISLPLVGPPAEPAGA